MNHPIEAISGRRMAFTATVTRFCTTSGWQGPLPTVRLANVCRRDTGEEVMATFRFISYSRGWTGVSVGDVIVFNATVSECAKGSLSWRDEVYYQTDLGYYLANPGKIRVLIPVEQQEVA